MTASGTPARADARGDIKALEDRFVAAFKAKDVDSIMKVHAPGQAFVVFDVVPPRQYVGAEAYRKDWQTFLGSFDGPITVELTDLDVGADPTSPTVTAFSASAAPTRRARSSI